MMYTVEDLVALNTIGFDINLDIWKTDENADCYMFVRQVFPTARRLKMWVDTYLNSDGSPDTCEFHMFFNQGQIWLYYGTDIPESCSTDFVSSGTLHMFDDLEDLKATVHLHLRHLINTLQSSKSYV